MIVYSKPNCGACEQAKHLLKRAGVPFDVVNLDVGQDKTASEKYISRDNLLELFPGARMMPQIMAEDGTRIGSVAELSKYLMTTA